MNQTTNQLISKYLLKYLEVFKIPFDGEIKEVLGNIMITNHSNNKTQSIKPKELEDKIKNLSKEKPHH